MALTTDEAIVDYLKRRDVPYSKVEALSGGYANYVWRVTGVPDPDSSLPGTKILKHAEPVLKAFNSMSFTVERMDFEAKALNIVSSTALAVPQKGSVNAPKLFWYDDEAHVMCISEGGSRNLKSASDSSVDVVSAGKILGEWLATFHSMGTGKGETTKHLLASFDNALAKSMSRHSYSNLAEVVEKTGLGLEEIQLAKRIDEEFGSLLQGDDECLCHGDFWPGNVLVGDSDQQLALMVVDWEMVRRGCSATDVGQFAAEAWLLDKFRGGRGLCKAFVESYAASSHKFGLEGLSTEQAERWSRRFAVHFAAHLAYWPTYVPWADAEGTKSFAQWAMDLAQAVVSGDLDRIRSNTVGGEFNPASVFLK